MERNREARRGSMAAMNGGLSRRRQRSVGLRDSPEEDGGEMEMAERTRLRDRGSKKERDRDRDRERERSSRSKRRRGERAVLHGGGGNRDEGEESSEDSTEEDDDDDDEDDVSVVVRLPPPLLPPPNTASSSSPLTHNNHHHYHQQQQQQLQRKSYPAKLAKSPMVWKTDEMIGVAVPRKARSAATKRSSHEWLVSGGGVLGGGGGGGSSSGGGGGDYSQIQRLSPPSISQISPSSSNASVRKKMKLSGAKQRPPPKVSKPASFIQEEIEIAEVLFGMTRQFQNSKDIGEPKSSRASSPNSICLPSTAQPSIPQPSDSMFNPSSLPVIAPKRKRPRPLKFEDESPISLASTSGSSAAKLEAEPQAKADTLLLKSEKMAESSAVENGARSPQIEATIVDALKGVKKDNQNSDLKQVIAESDHHDQMASREEPSLPSMEALRTDSDANHREASTAKAAPLLDDAREQKFSIDLMAPPPGKLSPERDGFCNYDTDEKSLCPENEMVKVTVEKKEDEKTVQSVKTGLTERKSEKPLLEEFIPKKAGELQHGLEKSEKESLSSNKLLSRKQQAKAPKAESRQDKVAPPASLSMSMTAGGWPGNFPHFGYVAQVPPLPAAIVPMDGNPGSSKALQGPTFLSMQPRPKRCATHCYIAQNIHYHQRIAKVNPLWPAAAGTAPLYGGKPYNLNVMPPPDAAFFGGPIRGSFPGSTTVDTKGSSMEAAPFPGNLSKEKTPAANKSMMEAAQRKQIVLEQTPQPGSAANMLHGPAFIFSLNQQQAAAAAAANLSGAVKSSAPAANGMPSPVTSTSATTSSTISGPTAAMNLSFAGLPHAEAQYLAILQNGAYPFPIAGGPPSYRGATPAQAMPFFNGPFYPSQMLHPSQLQAQQQQQQGSQQGHQNTSSLSTPSSSQKHSQQQPQRIAGGAPNGAATNSHGFPAGNQRPHLLPHQTRQQDGDKCSEDSPTTADSRVSQAQNSISGYNFAMPIHPPNFALMSTAAAAAALGSTGGSQNGKPSIYQQQQHQQQQHQQKQSSSQNIKVDLASSQHFTMPFASFTGPGAAPAGLDFSSMAHNHSLFQSLPEAARHGYHLVTMTAAAAAQATQKKKAHHHQITEEGKSLGGDSASTIVKGEDERKMSAAAKAPGNGSQHSVSFSKTENEPPISTIICSSINDSSSRTINLIPSSGNGNRTANKSTNAVSPTTISNATAGSSISISQQQHQLQQQQHQLQQQQHQLQQQQHQHFIHLQKQQHQMQQQQIQMQQQLGACRPKSSASSSNTSVYTEHLPTGSSDTKFPQALTSFSQALIHGGGSPSQSPQWKATNARGAAHAPAPAPSSASVVGKNNHLLQHQGRAPQQALPSPSHQTQISFGMNSSKMVTSGANLSGGATNPSLSSASTIAVGSPSNSGSKSVSGSPGASASALPAPSAAILPLPQQPSVKNTASNSGSKSTPMGNRNMPSILGQPSMTPAPNSSTKQQQQQQAQLKQQPFNHHSQLFFSNAYMQQAQSQANAAAAATSYYHRRQTELEQPQQQNSAPGSTGMIAICPSSLMVAGAPASADPAKTVTAAANKGIPSPGRLQTHLGGSAQSASPHLNPASFSYMSMPPVSMKSAADQKPAAGNDNLHACWQPEKK